MFIKYRRYDALKKENVQHIITNVDHIQAHVKYLFYWLIGQPKFIFRINMTEVNDVRIENETSKITG